MKSFGSYSSVLILVFAGVLLGALSVRLIDSIILVSDPTQILSNGGTKTENPQNLRRKVEIPFNCTTFDLTKTCPQNISTTQKLDLPSSGACPEYFRWIHEDLRPWAVTGITKEMVDRAQGNANFKLVILNGRVYIQKFNKFVWQTRDVFTQYGIVQLLRRYPGKLPDLELMFHVNDLPEIKTSNYSRPGDPAPPPLFSYCGDDESFNIVFPDWSYWGWPEYSIKPWEQLIDDLEEGNKRTKWMEREPYAYWKGNPERFPNRVSLMKCNVSSKQDWGARLYKQNWRKEAREGFKDSDLASQCTNRFKIYVEGNAWSVSEKYILGCDSVTLIVKPRYYDFFTRGLMPMQHYWPIKDDDKCRAIKFAVDWGNDNPQKAQDIGRGGTNFVRDQVKMDYVYDYMFHLLNEYAKIMKYKPEVPENAVEICSENMVCPSKGLQKTYMMDSMVKSSPDSGPCTMPPSFAPASLHALIRTKENSISQVDHWEKQF